MLHIPGCQRPHPRTATPSALSLPALNGEACCALGHLVTGFCDHVTAVFTVFAQAFLQVKASKSCQIPALGLENDLFNNAATTCAVKRRSGRRSSRKRTSRPTDPGSAPARGQSHASQLTRVTRGRPAKCASAFSRNRSTDAWIACGEMPPTWGVSTALSNASNCAGGAGSFS